MANFYMALIKHSKTYFSRVAGKHFLSIVYKCRVLEHDIYSDFSECKQSYLLLALYI